MSSSKIIKQCSPQDKGVGTYTPKEVTDPVGGRRRGKKTGDRASALEQDNHQKGFQAGERAGRESGIQQVNALQRTLTQLLAEIKTLKQEILQNADRDILKIAIAAARHILRQEISQDPDRTQVYIREAAKKLGHTETMLIRIPPQDLQRLTGECTEIMQAVEGVQWLKFEPAADLLPGECVIEGRDRTLDARIDSQLRILQERLENETLGSIPEAP